MAETAGDLIARTNETTQALLRSVAEERPVGSLGPEFLRTLRARKFELVETGEIAGFRIDPYANKVYLGSEFVEDLRTSFARYCVDDDTVYVPRTDLLAVPAAQQHSFAAAMLDMFFVLFILHETLHERQRLTSYNYHQTDSFVYSIRRVDYVADRLSIVSLARLLRRSGKDWAAALMVSDPLAIVMRLIQVHCFGMAHFARLGKPQPRLTKPTFYRLMTWHVQFHRTSAVARQRSDPLPLLDREPIFDLLAWDQIKDASPVLADRVLVAIESLREKNPPPANLSILAEPPGALPVLCRFVGSSPTSLESFIRGIYSSSFRMTEPFLLELFDEFRGLLALPEGESEPHASPAAKPVPEVRGSAPPIAFDPVSVAHVEVAVREPSSHFGRMMWGNPGSSSLPLSVQGDLMEVARRREDCTKAVETIFNAFSIAEARSGRHDTRFFATRLRLLGRVRIVNLADSIAMLHVPEQRERTLPGAGEHVKYRILTEGSFELGPGQSRFLTLDISVYYTDQVEPDRHEDGRPWHLHSSALVLLRLAKAMRDRVARAVLPDGAIPTLLEVVDMDASRREVEINLQIVEALKELPAWDFDLASLEQAFGTIDAVAVPAYHEEERAKLRKLVEERSALEERGHGAT